MSTPLVQHGYRTSPSSGACKAMSPYPPQYAAEPFDQGRHWSPPPHGASQTMPLYLPQHATDTAFDPQGVCRMMPPYPLVPPQHVSGALLPPSTSQMPQHVAEATDEANHSLSVSEMEDHLNAYNFKINLANYESLQPRSQILYPGFDLEQDDKAVSIRFTVPFGFYLSPWGLDIQGHFETGITSGRGIYESIKKAQKAKGLGNMDKEPLNLVTLVDLLSSLTYSKPPEVHDVGKAMLHTLSVFVQNITLQ
ncbi:hypothetical protein EJ04DRAFT_591173 [Polyplosphaeria fusca]|uniref:Uncharacterized protein n=1 Tax=Polyplosphaeria fusca TaxID=682080 RepID=A0A9P4UVU1_9PLEO|nr:hypothetical protein EJ04DRAFT_591173 [Polyplosphaeria fusca]